MKTLKCYISCSLLQGQEIITKVKNYLETFGIEVTYYDRNQVYTNKKLREADFVVFIGYYNPALYDIDTNRRTFQLTVSKGQYNEAEYCNIHNKTAFIYHPIIIKTIWNFSLYEKQLETTQQDWKKRFGYLQSYFRRENFPDLKYFLEGHFGVTLQSKVKKSL